MAGPEDSMCDVTEYTTQQELRVFYSHLKNERTKTHRMRSFSPPVLYERSGDVLAKLGFHFSEKNDVIDFEFYPEGTESGNVKIVGQCLMSRLSTGSNGTSIGTVGTGDVTWDTAP